MPKFGIAIGHGQQRFIIYINSVDLEALMLQSRFKDNQTSGKFNCFTLISAILFVILNYIHVNYQRTYFMVFK